MEEGALRDGELELLGAHPRASNLAVLAEVVTDQRRIPVIYKPVAGERPLWDFPDGTLAGREVATYVVSRLGGFDLVPETVLRDGPLGPGAVQRWVGEQPVTAPSPITVTDPDEVPTGYLTVLHGEDEVGDPVVVSHPDSAPLRSLAVLDAVLNNSDRKGSHVLDRDGATLGIDHGVCLHAEPKLRTVLWGWAGEPIADADLDRLRRLAEAIAPGTDGEAELDELLTISEVAALRERVEALLSSGRHPQPSGDWPSVPWPPL